ncbi:MAG: DNA polymerase III subunit epsilon [Rubrivivax sp. SCN 71-131]|jgi:DNA polymerase-3 subunit epsilon|nr:MAG: DNA polymerase III subunit epsilon [Rubrivivax sp. SCN 71-131]
MTRQVFFDTETTGLDPDKGDRIVEIGCVEMVDRRLSGRTLHLYLNPGRSSHPEALKVHGLTDAFLADKPAFADVAEQLLDFLRGAELIIHNAGFDVGFVDAELARARRGALAEVVARVTDTLTMARDLYPGKANSLDALCRRLEVDARARTLHGALLDAGLLAEVYIRMTRGQESLVMDAQTSTAVRLEVQAVDLAGIALPVIDADPAEIEAHEAMLRGLDEASGGKTLWRLAQAMA